FTVIGPHDPVTAILGQEAVLPCHLSPRMSAANMEVRWFRSQFLSFVHLYRDGKDQYEGQMPEYWGRTELLKAGLTDGNVPLRILNIRRSDEGQYHCFVQDDIFSEETTLELRVAGLGSAPLISVEGHQDGGIRVVCRSAGWYPEPEVLWKDLNGRHLPSLSETKSQGDNNLFETETVIIVTEHANQNLSCCIRNTVLNQEKESAVYICHCLCVLLYFTAHFTVIGSDQAVTSSIGDEAILHCHLSPKMSTENMEVRWFRSKFSSPVHLYRDQKDQYVQQMPEYRGRTELLKDGMADGRVALKIRNITFSDAGWYSCFFRSNVSYEEALIELKLAASGSDPLISVEDYQDEGIRIVCQSIGWYPEPELQWRDRSGNHLSSLFGKKSQSENGLFSIQHMLIITEKSIRNLSCSIRNSVLKQEKVSRVYISGEFLSNLHNKYNEIWLTLMGSIY
uniref:Ig-like domain-containing protein n=1 Tax=Chrysemys picta bellii TaxID=8478 RepID=A0A8C3I7J9_CHRPI